MSKFINKFIISIIVFYIFWLGIFPFVLSKGTLAVFKNISHNSEYKIDVENLKIYSSVLPQVKIKADKLAFDFKPTNTNLKLDDFEMKVRVLPLLSGKLHINSINIDEFNLEHSLKKQISLDKEFINRIENANFICDSFKVNSFKALLFEPDEKTPIQYEANGFEYQLRNRFLKVVLNSTLTVDEKLSTTNVNLYLPKNNDIKKTVFDIDVSNFDLEPFEGYFKNYLPSDIEKIKGVINAKANKDELITELNNCMILMKDSAKSVIFPQKMSVKSKFNITRQTIFLEHVDFYSNNINASINGRINDYFGKSMPSLDLNIIVNKSRIEDLISIIPAFKIEEIDFYQLKKHKFYGDVLANISIKGRLPEPDVNGEVFIDDGVLTKPIPNTSRGATIKLDFTGRYVNFDVFVPAGFSEKVWVKGSQELYNVKYADLTVKSTQNLNLGVAQRVVTSLREILNFIVGPLPIINLDGSGYVDIIVKGNRKNPHLWGALVFKNSIACFKGMPNAVLTDSDSVLTFKDQDVQFSSSKGFMNGKELKIDGVANLFGKFNFNIVSKAQSSWDLYKAVKSSTLVPEISNLLPEVEKISGNMDLDLKVYGDVKTLDELKFNKNFFAKGNIKLIDNSYTIQNIDLTKTNGTVLFDTNFVDANINSSVGNSPMTVIAKVKNDFADLVLDIPKLNPNFLLRDDRLRVKQYLPYVLVKAKYRGNVNNIEYDKLNFNAKILSSNPESILKFNSGDVILSNNKLNIKSIKGYFSDPKNIFYIDLRTEDAFSEAPLFNGVVNLKTPDIVLLNDLVFLDILPDNFRKLIRDFELKKGSLVLDCRVFNNYVNANTDLGGISFVYLPMEMPVDIINGTLAIRNNALKLNKINILADDMPILADGEIRDIFDKQNFNLYFNSKPKQDFIDKYINKNQLYPIKIKGDIVYWARLKGVKDSFDLKSEIDLSKNSSVYHFGATVGDIENAIEVSIDSKVIDGNNLKIKEFSYDKIIDSQSGKQTKLNMLKTSGGVEILKDDLGFKDLRIKTTNPTDARIFNIIFRKPNIKQGQFTSDLRLNGKLSNPKVVGDFHIFETDIPFFDTTMKNIELVFKDKNVNFSSKGEVLGNDIIFEGVLRNKLTKPYYVESANLYAKNLDLNQFVDKIKTVEINELSSADSIENIDARSIVAKNFKLKADNIHLRNIMASDFEALISLSEKGLLDVNSFKFNIAQGVLNGKYKYDLNSNDQSINLNADKINANDITWALFDLREQIYGDMTGAVNLSCNGSNFQNCMETLSGNGDFTVVDGRMPKLGSLEYLLKAGNLVKGGITGLSINSVVDIITPLKTGEFEMISGNFRIKDGVARNVEIASRGKDLSLYTTGTYNFATAIADMQVLGLLSKKISTFLGPIGNMSINTLFNVIPGVDLSKDSRVLERINKIPGVELSSKAYRRFIAEIKGNLNGEDYVTSFKWIN